MDKIIQSFIEWSFDISLNSLPQFLVDAHNIMLEQAKQLHDIKTNKHSEPFLQKIERHEEMIAEMEQILNILQKIYESYSYQNDFMEADDTAAHESNFFITFNTLKDQFKEVLSRMNCSLGATSFNDHLLSIYEKLEDLRKKIYPYLQKRRDEYYRLYFLSDSELFQLILPVYAHHLSGFGEVKISLDCVRAVCESRLERGYGVLGGLRVFPSVRHDVRAGRRQGGCCRQSGDSVFHSL